MRIAARVLPVTDGLDTLFEGRRPTLTAPEVAEILGITKQGVYHWLRDGTIPGYKVGSTWFIITAELKETLRQGANVPRAGGPTRAHDEEQEEG